MSVRERVADRVTALRAWFQATTWVTVIVVNADNYRRPPGQVGLELKAMAAAYRPHFIDVVEALGNVIPPIDGYVLIRDDSTKARENVAAYIREDLPLSRVEWEDMVHGWPRTEGPGTHEPRSILTYRISRLRRAVAHEPDPRAQGPAKREHRAALRRIALAYKRWPFVLGEDSNGNASELVSRAGLTRFGQRVDTVLARGALRGHANYLTEFPAPGARGVVRFAGDHGHVLKVDLRIPVRFITPRPKETP